MNSNLQSIRKPHGNGKLRVMRAASLALIISLAGCAKMMGTVGTKAGCDTYNPISWSTKDTDQTIEEVKEHNAAYAALCGPTETKGQPS